MNATTTTSFELETRPKHVAKARVDVWAWSRRLAKADEVMWSMRLT